MESAEGTEEFLQAIMNAHCPGEVRFMTYSCNISYNLYN